MRGLKMSQLVGSVYRSFLPATGILKGYDQLLNLVIDGCVEHLQGTEH